MATYISIDDVVYGESDDAIVFTISVSGDAPTSDIVIDYATVDGTAMDATDYDTSSGSVTILMGPPVGELVGTISVPITDDLLAEGIEGILLNIASSTPGVVITRNTVTGLIVDNDLPKAGSLDENGLLIAKPNVSISNTVVDEAAGIATITIMLDRPSISVVTVLYETRTGYAAPGQLPTDGDYATTNGSVVLQSGQTSATFDVLINNDALAEGREVFSVALPDAFNAVVAAGNAHVVIQYSDAPAVATPVVSVQGATVIESQGYVDFLVTLNAPGIAETRVTYNTNDGSAIDGTDYESVIGTLVFAPGETSKTVRVLVADTAATDATRTFSLDLSGLTGLVSGTLSANAVILDNETLAVTPPTALTPVVITGDDRGSVLSGTMYDDSITGGAGNDLLDGRAGADTLTGGAGDDIYIVENVGDVVVELADGGNDTLISYLLDNTLADPVEHLVLGSYTRDSGGVETLDSDGTGNASANSITGNTGENILNGMGGNDTLNGGGGRDTLIGGSGDDTYIVDSDTDLITENLDEGTDSVLSSTTLTLAANIENLTLTGALAINATGNTLNNVLTGNTGDNMLSGLAGNDTLTGGDGNDTLDGGAGVDSLTGGLGDDHYVYEAGDAIVEAPGGGFDTIDSAETLTLAVANVENILLTGTANINATGDALANVLTGNVGNNVLDGGVGNDTLVGGAGNDTYVVDSATDVVTEGLNEGIDLVQSSVTHTLSANVDNLTLTGLAAIDGTGNELNNLITGNTAVNTLTGGDGNDTLDGGAGVDSLVGGAGDDHYVYEAGDVIVEAAGVGGGSDTLDSAVTLTLAVANVENILLTGTANVNATGDGLANTLTGNTGNNTLTGGAGNDTLIGGAGIDTLDGGANDDTFIVDSSTDVIIEALNEGADTVQSSVTFVLTNANVENLTLTGALAINGTGNALANVLTGNTGNNTLNGADGNDTILGGDGNDTLDGGVGVDSLTGGAGDDHYVYEAGDVIVEAAGAGGGSDTLDSAVTLTLAVANVENILLTGTANINATGDGQANVLTGNSGNNTLNGGVGTDTMVGGQGNDVYFVDNTADVVTEAAGEGTDLVQSGASYTLGANVEQLILIGSAAINGTGNTLDNALFGNLNAGANVLTGGLGNDTYVVGAGDTVVEGAGQGTDLVQSAVSWVLSTNVENLTLTGVDAIDGTGNELANTLTGNAAANVLTGGLGNDTYVVGAGDTVVEGSSQGTDQVQSAVSWVLSANVENLTLTGTAAIDGTGNELNNTLTGNTGNNVLIGGAGNDTINAGAGVDTVSGGQGNDLYFVDNTADVITELAGEGSDVVQAFASYTLSANLETLILVGAAAIDGTGNELGNLLQGNAAGNILSGAGGSDVLNGGAGADTMIGGLGIDRYIVDNVGDVIIEVAGEGVDLVEASVSYTLSANVENLTLTGAAVINGTGSADNNVLTGNGAANVLSGAGGNDTYVVGAGDTVVEAAGEGTDFVQSAVSWTLSANVENLTLTGAGAINATGNELANVLTGNSAANVLTGGLGNDTYVVGAGDTTVELADQGTDTVMSAVNWTLGANVENLSLTGTGAISGTGNELANAISGNISSNLLVGGGGNDTINGGAGTDTMNGGQGNDLYFVDNTGDVIGELAGEGTDQVQSSVSYTLGANVEQMILTGAGAINATGNTLVNTLIGNGAANVISGGLGNDALRGGLGNDTFVFDTALSAATNVDTIVDFTAGDHLQLSAGIFTNLGAAGTLAADHFFSGAGVTGSSGAGGIYYDTTSGGVYYDADGSGALASTRFATLTGLPALTSNDFFVG